MTIVSALFATSTAVASLIVPTADVGVIGAGPAGLTLCHALHAEGYSVRVFERRDCFRPVGAAVFMYPMACNSLRAISPELERQLLGAATQIETLSYNTLGDAPSFRLDTLGDATRTLGAPFLAIRFWDMLCALKLGLPDECFAFGHQLERYEQHGGEGEGESEAGGEGGGITLHFAEGKPPCRVRFLIDAGGIRSATRKQLIGDAPIPRLRATFSLLPADRVNCQRDSVGGGVPGELGFVTGDNLSVVTMGLSDGGVMWSETDFGDAPADRLFTSEAALRQRLDARYCDASWPENIRAMAEATQLGDVVESTVSELPVSWKWGEGDVTLLGDAAHAQLPALGLGISTALGDVEELIAQIKRHGLSRRALRRYERGRMPACAALQLMSRTMWRLSTFAANR